MTTITTDQARTIRNRGTITPTTVRIANNGDTVIIANLDTLTTTEATYTGNGTHNTVVDSVLISGERLPLSIPTHTVQTSDGETVEFRTSNRTSFGPGSEDVVLLTMDEFEAVQAGRGAGQIGYAGI